MKLEEKKNDKTYLLLLFVIYLAFIGLGLPDSLLGAALPSMREEIGFPVSYGGIVSMIISIGTVISSLNSDKLNRKFGTGKIVSVSIPITAIALFGFSFTDKFYMLCLWAIPYGLGAGCIDSALNNYVAMHYTSRHMSWLHCMWGVGTIVGPYAIRYGISSGNGWEYGYRFVGIIVVVLSVIMILSQPLWKKHEQNTLLQSDSTQEKSKAYSIKEILRFKGIYQLMITFFCYCALEQTTMLWASSYMVIKNGVSPKIAAGYASMFFIGITIGRGINGFLAIKFVDKQLVRLGQIIIAVGIILISISQVNAITLAGLVIIGLGCAPIYPCVIHSTPYYFGKDSSQAVIGFEMASAYVGICAMPPLFGLIANYLSVSFLPLYLGLILVVMIIAHEMLVRVKANKE